MTDTVPATKQCSRCGEEKSSHDFYRQASSTDGLKSRCKKCHNQKRDALRAKLRKPRLYLSDIEKECSQCHERKPLGSFFTRAKSTKLRPECKTCSHAGCKVTNRQAGLKRMYGITVADYDRMLTEQRGVCAICQSPPNPTSRFKHLSVDHCHRTGNVRGLLCHNCNKAIGLLRDDPSRVTAVAQYLTKHGASDANVCDQPAEQHAATSN